MIQVTAEVQHAAWRDGNLPAIERVSSRVWSVPVDCTPLPVRYTFCYLVVGEDGSFIVIDPGWASEEGDARLREGMSRAGLHPENMAGVVVTHFHPDHLGAAERLMAGTDAWLAMHPLDAAFLDSAADPAEFVRRTESWLESSGVPEGIRERMVARAKKPRQLFTSLRVTKLLDDGAAIPLQGRSLRTVWTPGHTAGHLCVVDDDEQLIFTGDHVLPRISPNIGAYGNAPDRDSVGEYCSSLDKVKAWDGYEVCPAHEYRFRGLSQRVRDIAADVAGRGQEIRSVLAAQPEATPWEVASQVPWKRPWETFDDVSLNAALAETRAHLNHIKSSEQ